VIVSCTLCAWPPHCYKTKHFLIWLLTTPPHLKYVATLLYNLSLMACFLTSIINVSQGSVATYARCGRIFNNRFSANSPRNLSVKKKSENRLRFDRNIAMRLSSHFFGPSCSCECSQTQFLWGGCNDVSNSLRWM